MQASDQLVLYATAHPAPTVQRAGFPLDHAYLELCWGSVAGPSVVAFLRRMPILWQAAEPARMSAHDLASGLGLSVRGGLARTLQRLAMFGFVERPTDLEVGVFTQVPPVSARLLRRSPQWVADTHEHLLDEHLRQLAAGPAVEPAAVANLRARLDQPPPTAYRSVSPGPLAR